MTIHVISVGLSILDNLRDSRRRLGDRGKPGLDAAVRTWLPDRLLQMAGVHSADKAATSSWLAGVLAPPSDPSHDAVAAGRLAAMTQAIKPDQWPRDISAEIATFAAMKDARRPLPGTDIAVLVCSDTPDGLLAGAWNAVVLAGADLSRICYLAAPADGPEKARGRVLLVRVPGLDAGEETGFRQAMGGLGTLGRSLLRSGELGDGEAFRFYLSGGFKAAIPYLIGLAEGLRSVDPDRPVDAFVQHETATAGAPPIRLPLRRFMPDQVEQELSGYNSTGVRTGEPGAALLKGYAYEVSRNGQKCTLTAFGAGLRALFGLSPEWPGG